MAQLHVKGFWQQPLPVMLLSPPGRYVPGEGKWEYAETVMQAIDVSKLYFGSPWIAAWCTAGAISTPDMQACFG